MSYSYSCLGGMKCPLHKASSRNPLRTLLTKASLIKQGSPTLSILALLQAQSKVMSRKLLLGFMTW